MHTKLTQGKFVLCPKYEPIERTYSDVVLNLSHLTSLL
jgi:hypothetical protein